MRDQMIETLEKELQMLNTSWRITFEHTEALLASYADRQVSQHLAHNLANCATDLSELAGKIDSTQRILAYVREQQ